MNLQPRVEKAPTYISKLKVGIKVMGHEQQDVAFIDAPMSQALRLSVHIIPFILLYNPDK